MTEQEKIELLDRVVERLDELGAERMVHIHEKYYFDPPFLQKMYEANVPKSQHKILTNEKGSFVMKFQDFDFDIIIMIEGATFTFQDINMLFVLQYYNGSITIIPDKNCKNTSFTYTRS